MCRILGLGGGFASILSFFWVGFLFWAGITGRVLNVVAALVLLRQRRGEGNGDISEDRLLEFVDCLAKCLAIVFCCKFYRPNGPVWRRISTLLPPETRRSAEQDLGQFTSVTQPLTLYIRSR